MVIGKQQRHSTHLAKRSIVLSIFDSFDSFDSFKSFIYNNINNIFILLYVRF